MRKIAFMIGVALFTSNCATMFHGTRETIHVRSEEPNTHFFVNEQEIGNGTIAITSLPKKQLRRSFLRARKAHCLEKIVPIETEFDFITLMSLPFDYGFGFVFLDWMTTGAVYRVAQTHYILTPDCTQEIQKTPPPAEAVPEP